MVTKFFGQARQQNAAGNLGTVIARRGPAISVRANLGEASNQTGEQGVTRGRLIVNHADGNAVSCAQHKIIGVDVAPVAWVDERDRRSANSFNHAGGQEVTQAICVYRYSQDATARADCLVDEAPPGEINNACHDVGPPLGFLPIVGGPNTDVYDVGLG
jgi:hypothetical protein